MEPMTFSISPRETKLAREMLPGYTSGVLLAKIRYERLGNLLKGMFPAVMVWHTLPGKFPAGTRGIFHLKG